MFICERGAVSFFSFFLASLCSPQHSYLIKALRKTSSQLVTNSLVTLTMLCELAVSYDLSLLSLWALLCVLGLFAVFFSSGVVFYIQYVCHSYEQWCYKTLPTYPSASDVRLEILATLKGMAAATIPPTLSIYLSQRGYSSGLRHIMHTGRLIQDKRLRF